MIPSLISVNCDNSRKRKDPPPGSDDDETWEETGTCISALEMGSTKVKPPKAIKNKMASPYYARQAMMKEQQKDAEFDYLSIDWEALRGKIPQGQENTTTCWKF